MRSLIVVAFLVVSGNCLAQASMTTSGNWATATNWSGSNIGDLVTETVNISNNVSPTVFNGSNFTVGATTLANNNTLTVNSGGTLNIGDASHASSLTTNNNANITVDGTLIIWGSLVVNNNIVWNITGTVIIKGDVQLSNNANLNVTGGNLQVGGNFTGGNNTNISVPSGSISVSGSVNVSNGSNLSGCTGCFQAGGGCSGPSSFCSNGALPITLATFEGRLSDKGVVLEWTTLSELNFDRFDVENSSTGKEFTKIGSVQGHGTTNISHDYSFEDTMPFDGVNYYRLKSVDLDGAFELSKIVAVSFTSDDKILVSPNPADGNAVRLFVGVVPGSSDRIVIYNNVGIAITEANNIRRGIMTLDKQLEPGIYMLSYSGETKSTTIRFSVK
jgi:hypothetical protein